MWTVVKEFFTITKNRFLIYGLIAFLVLVAGNIAYIKILKLERDAAVSSSVSDQRNLKAAQRALKSITEAMEFVRWEDAQRNEFTERVKKEMSVVKDDRPLSVNQRIVAKRVRERYTNKYRN